MFEGFDDLTIDTGEATIRARRGGEGRPVLLLHGIPETHVMWHKVAPRLAEEFTVVAADLRGDTETAASRLVGPATPRTPSGQWRATASKRCGSSGSSTSRSSGTTVVHAALAKLSTSSRHSVIAGAGHEIHLFEPSAVVQAIGDVVQSIRSKAPLPKR